MAVLRQPALGKRWPPLASLAVTSPHRQPLTKATVGVATAPGLTIADERELVKVARGERMLNYLKKVLRENVMGARAA